MLIETEVNSFQRILAIPPENRTTQDCIFLNDLQQRLHRGISIISINSIIAMDNQLIGGTPDNESL